MRGITAPACSVMRVFFMILGGIASGVPDLGGLVRCWLGETVLKVCCSGL